MKLATVTIAMLFSVGIADAYSLAPGFADDVYGYNVGLHEFLGDDPSRTTPKSGTRKVTAATASEQNEGGTNVDSKNMKEAILKDIEVLLKKLELLYVNAHEITTDANYSEEGPKDEYSTSSPHLDLKTIFQVINPNDTSKTLKIYNRTEEDTFRPKTNRNVSSKLTPESYDTEETYYVEEIKRQPDMQKKTDTQPETMETLLEFKKQTSSNDTDVNVTFKEQYQSAENESVLYENITSKTKPMETEIMSGGKTQITKLLIYTTPNTTADEILRAGVPESGKQHGKTTKTLEAHMLTNDEQCHKKNSSCEKPTETQLIADDSAEVPHEFLTKKFLNKKSSTATNKIESSEHKNGKLGTELTPRVETLSITGQLEQPYNRTYPSKTQETKDGKTLSFLDTWLSIASKVTNMKVVPELYRINTTATVDARQASVSNDTIRAVKELVSSQNMTIVVERSENTLQQVKAILHGIDDDGALGGQLLLVTYADKVWAEPCERAELQELLGQQRAYDGHQWSALEALQEAARSAQPGGDVLLLAGSRPSDLSLAYPVTRSLRLKRLKLNVVWCGPRSTGDEGSLRDLSWYTGGTFLISDKTASTVNHPQQRVTLVIQKGLAGSNEVWIPVDSSLRTVDITVEGPVREAVLYDPTGRRTDLRAPGAATLVENDSLLTARLNTTGATPGRWMLAVVGAGAVPYDVIARAPSAIDFAAKHGTDAADWTLNVMLQGDVDEVKEVSALDQLGREVAQLNYTRTAPMQLTVADQQLPSATSYLRISGSDINGETFQRVSYLPQETTAGTVSPVEIEMALNSTLSAHPGQTAQLIYTVTNNQELDNYIDFQCSSQHFNIYIQPQSFQLAAHQTVYVLVTVTVPQYTPQNTEDIITMTAIYGYNSGISNIAYFKVGQEVSDNEKPTINYSVDSDCGNTDTSDCQQKIWRAELVIQDKQSGLLQVTSEPKGLRLRSTFVAGTKDLIGAYYSATCCNPSVIVTATDAHSNYARQTITASPTSQLSTAATAGIVVGILLFIIIIIIAAVFVVHRRRHQSVSFPQTTER